MRRQRTAAGGQHAAQRHRQRSFGTERLAAVTLVQHAGMCAMCALRESPRSPGGGDQYQLQLALHRRGGFGDQPRCKAQRAILAQHCQLGSQALCCVCSALAEAATRQGVARALRSSRGQMSVLLLAGGASVSLEHCGLESSALVQPELLRTSSSAPQRSSWFKHM